jgi:hypothetical protein
VEHGADVGLVDAHPKSNGRHHHADGPSEEVTLHLLQLFPGVASVEGPGDYPDTSKRCGRLVDRLSGRGIHDCRALGGGEPRLEVIDDRSTSGCHDGERQVRPLKRVDLSKRCFPCSISSRTCGMAVAVSAMVGMARSRPIDTIWVKICLSLR